MIAFQVGVTPAFRPPSIAGRAALVQSSAVEIVSIKIDHASTTQRGQTVKSKIAAALLTAILGGQTMLQAQGYRALIRGRLTDANNLPLAGAQLRLLHKSTNETRLASSGRDGEYAFAFLPPGAYRLEIEHPGHGKDVRDFDLFVNQELRLDIELKIGALQEAIVVSAPFTPLRKDSMTVGTVIENRQIVGLPLDGRNFLELSLLVPGTAPAAQGSAGSVRGDFAFNVNGAREDGNNFLLDGAYNVDPKLNTFGVKPPVDAIQEFEVLTSTYDAAFGRNGGGQVNVVLKSGTNLFHGTVYEFFRNGALDARNFFAPSSEPKPKYQRNQFGFSLGGPIAQDRTFFFADYEGTRAREGITRITNVPTMLERSGDFSQSAFAQPIDPFTQQPFPQGRIPPEQQHPVGRAIAALYPQPNRSVPFENFVASPSLRDRVDQFDARIDHQLSGRSQLAVRYSFSDRFLYEPFSGRGFSAVPGFGTNIPRRYQNVTVSETHTFSPAFINEIRFAYGRVSSGSLHENQGNSLNEAVGLPEPSSNPRDWGLSFITLTGYSPLGDEYNNPQHSVTNSFQALDQATYVRGRHLLKFGGDLRAVQQNAYRDVQSRGFLTFSSQVPVIGQITGNALADLLVGLPYLTGGAHIDNYQHLRTESVNFFVHDNFRILPRLTLSAGLRYEFNSPPVDVDDRATLYDLNQQTLVPVGTNGMPRSGYLADKNNWAPRLGLAWTPGSRESTVLRAGYGIYYDQSALAPGEGLYFNVPYYDLGLYFSLPGLPLTLSNPFPSFFPFSLPDSAQAFDRNLRTAYMQHWNFGWQQQLGRSRVLEAAYIGSKGTKLIAGRDINQPRPSPQPLNPRPVPQFEDINQVESRVNSNYHSLQFRLQQRLDSGLSLLSSYTWSKSLDNASGFFSSAGDANYPQDSFNVSAERGRSNFDVRHRFSFSYSYDLPIGRGHSFLGDLGWISSFLAGWQTHGILTLQSGRPFTVALLPEIDWSNTGRSNLGFGANDRPNMAGDPRLDRRDPERWFNTAAFAFQAFGTFGNSGRNILDGPGFQNFNFSLVKQATLREGLTLQFRTEFFNLFNRPNFDLPDIFLGSPTFGRILSAQSPRHIQFGLKLVF
jgi:Carboxypeptidase regulatory-like domain